MKFRWDKLGGQLGIVYCLAGLVLIFLGWNGAASYDREPAQIPYVVSGGLGGLALVVIGAAMLIVAGNRADRAALQASIDELRATLERGVAMEADALEGGELSVLAGTTSYHRPDCQLVEGQEGLTPMSLPAAQAGDLEPCRICAPDASS
jgi:hypothetical protein